MSAIKAENLVKTYGDVKAVNGVSFEVRGGSIFGFLGPNGAGKSTTQRILTGVVSPDKGSVEIMGESLFHHPVKAKQKVGVVPEQANVYTDLTALENLMFIGEIYNVSRQAREKRAEEYLKLFNLYEKKDVKARGFSKGMKQRLLLCMAMMSDPDILFLDEPTQGLDLESRQIIREMINGCNREGKTVFLTTHEIEEASRLCHEIAIINRGQIAVIDTPSNLRQSIQKFQSVQVIFSSPLAGLGGLENLEGVEQVKTQGEGYLLYTPDPGRAIVSLSRFAEDEGVDIVSLSTLEPSLEEVFIYFIGQNR